MRAASSRLAAAVLLVLTAGVPGRSVAQQLVPEPGIGRFLEALYGQVAGGKLDLAPFYGAAGIVVSDRACDPAAGSGGARACASSPCPAGKALGLAASCLYDGRAGIGDGDLLVKPPYPVRRLGDYDPEWSAFQFKALQAKLGGRLPPIGMVRTLAVPGQERSGFFEYVAVDRTSDGAAQVGRWMALAKGGGPPACGATTCFSVHRVVPAPGNGRGRLSAAMVECVGRRIKSVDGPPEYCVPIYLQGSRGTFISALTSFRNESMRVDRGLVGAKVFFDSGTGKPDFEAVAALLEKAFASAPLGLETSRDPDAVVGVSAMRPSQVMDKWQETATVRAVMNEVPLAISEPGGATRSLVGIRVGLATTLYVNNRNTTDESEWRMPTAAQGASYDAAVVATIKAEAVRECAGASTQVRDSVTVIACGSPRW